MRKILEAIAATAEIMGQAISPTAAAILAKDLSTYPAEKILEALEVTRKGSARFSAKAIFDAIEKLSPDGRPGADEAWAMIPRDEYTSVVMTEEMAEAYGIALPLLNEGDQVAARMAFKEAYARIVESHRQAGVQVKWFPSLGRDPEMRVTALETAARLGRIGYDHAASSLPPVQSATLLECHQPALAIEDKRCSPEVAKENLAKIHAMLAAKPIKGIV